MKKLEILLLLFLLVQVSCKKENGTICNVDNPATELAWIVDIISLAEIDSVGNYIGTIYLEYYNGKPVFFIDMSMGSGGVIGYWFNCDGSTFKIDDQQEFIDFSNGMKLNKIIFTNM
jgi:hypothetical protein